jgi:hypothetical protein
MRGRVENLRFFTSDQDREAARRNGRKGGLVSGELRRERRRKREAEQAEKLLRPWNVCLEKSTFGRLRYRHQLFCYAMCTYGNAAEAARQAGYSPRYAKERGCRLLQRVDVREGIKCLVLAINKESDPAKYPGLGR